MGLFKLKIATAMAVTLATLTLGLVAADGPKVSADKPAAGVAKAVVAEKPAAVEGDLAAMQGLWEYVRSAPAGPAGDAPAPPKPSVQALVRGDVLWLITSENRSVQRYELRLTPGRNPKWIDLVTDSCICIGPAQSLGAVTPCVYRLTAEGLELAMSNTGKFRPADFVSDSNVSSIPLRRPKPPDAPDAKLADARKEFVGRWTVTRQAYPHDNRSAMVDRPVGEVEITPEFMFIQRPGSDKNFVWQAAEYTLDPTKDPKWIDLSFAENRVGDANGFGVYELAGDTLRISYRLSVPRVFRTLEFKAGIEEPLTGADGKPEPIKPACGLLELKRVKTP